MNIQEELSYRLSVGCDYIVNNLHTFDDSKNNPEILQKISLLLTASNLLNRNSLKRIAEIELNNVRRNIFSSQDRIFFLDNGKSLTYNNIVLTSIYLKLKNKDYFQKVFNVLLDSLTDNSVSIYYPQNEKEVSFHLLPMIGLLNFFSRKDTSDIDLSYYLDEVYNSYSIDISHEISYAVWLNSILSEYEGEDLNLRNKANKIVEKIGERPIEGMSSLYAAIYQQSLSFDYSEKNLELLRYQFGFQLSNGAFIQRKNKPVNTKSTIQNLWSFILCLSKLNQIPVDSLF